jgi:hypothetical protein
MNAVTQHMTFAANKYALNLLFPDVQEKSVVDDRDKPVGEFCIFIPSS